MTKVPKTAATSNPKLRNHKMPQHRFEAFVVRIKSVPLRIEHPLSGPDATVRGRDKVREHAARLATVGDMATETIAVHETDDPEVVIHEFTTRATFDGKEVTMAGIRVMRVRDGVIVSSRDYGNRR